MIRIWRGDAPAQAKSIRIVQPEFNAPVTFSIGNKSLEFGSFNAASIVAAWNASAFPEFTEITATVSGSDVMLDSDIPGVLFDVEVSSPAVITIDTVQSGRAAVDQQTTLTVPSAANGGTFTVTADFGSGGETTGAIDFDAPATGVSSVQEALIALATPVAGDIVVSGDAGGPYLITFTQNFSGQGVTVSADGSALVGVGDVEVTVVQEPRDQTREIQICWFNTGPKNATSNGVLFRLSDQTLGSSSLVAWTQLQTALDEVYGAGEANVLLQAADFANEFGENIAVAIIEWTDTEINRDPIQPEVEVDESPRIAVSRELQAAGAAENHEFWLLTHDVLATGFDTYTITHDGNTTTGLEFDGTGDPEAALEALVSLTNVTIHNLPSAARTHVYVVEFEDADADEPDITVSATSGTITATKIKDGGPLHNTIQRLQVTADGGTFTLSDGTDTTLAINHDETAATIETRLETDITAITDVVVTGAFPIWHIEFAGAQAQTNVEALTGDASSLVGGDDPTTPTTTFPVSPINEKQTVTLSPNVSGGTFTLALGSPTTGTIDFDETAAALEAIFDTALGAGTTAVTGVPGGPYTIEFTGSLAAQNVQPLAADASGLTVTGGAEIEEVTRSRGPNHADDPLNWTGDGPIDSQDTLIIERGDVDLLYGLNWVSPFTASALDDELTVSEHVDLWDGQAVRVWTDGGTLPGGLSVDTNYFVRNFNREQKTLQLAATEGGAAINLSSDGSGDLFVGVVLAGVQVYQRFTGHVGLPVFNDALFYEYRQRHWQFALLASTAENIFIGKGEGSGSGLLRLEVAADHDAHVRVYNTGGSEEPDQPTCQFLVDDATSTFTAEGGSSGIAVLNEQSSTLLTVEARGDGSVHLGPNVTVTNVRSTGGGEITSDEANSGALVL